MRTLPVPAAGTPIVVSPPSLERLDSPCSSRSSSPDRANSSGSNQSAQHEVEGDAHGKPARKWVRKEKVGQGAQGCVYRCLETATGREAACKVILLRDLSAVEVSAIKREVATIKRLKHSRLVRYWRATEVPHKRLSIYMELVSGGALSGWLRRQGALPMPLVQKFTRQLCEALAFLHARGIAHRDIKCANVFLTSAGEDADIKLGDFGAFKETGSASLVGGLKGTPHWMAPEVIRGEPPSVVDSTGGDDGSGDGESWWFRADVWSLGCATLEMLTGQAPWRQYSNPHTAMYQIVTSNNTPSIPADVSDETASFLKRCLQRDPMNRATIAELLKHPFLNGREVSGNCSSSGSGETRKEMSSIEPESSPTVKSDEEHVLTPTATSGLRRLGAAGGQIKSLRDKAEVSSGDQRQPKHDASPQYLRPSRIPRLKSLDPLKTKKKTPTATTSSPANNNHDEDGDNHLKQSSLSEKPPSGTHPGTSQLPRLVSSDKSSKKRAFAIPKHSLMPTSSAVLTEAGAPRKPAGVARRAVRAIAPLPQQRAATAPPLEASLSSLNAGEMAMSPPGDGNNVTRLKLPPLVAGRTSTASSCR